MIQDLLPHHFDNAYVPRKPEPEDYVLYFSGDRVLCRTQGGLDLPRWAQATPQAAHFAFRLDDRAVFLADGEPELLPPGFSMEKSYALRRAAPQHMAFAIGVGGSLARWYGGTRFCGACGAPMADATAERACVCTGCGRIVYPRICPAIIAAVTDGDRLLLTRYRGSAARAYALVAGFAEIGESIEDTVRREVLEETGLHLGRIRYYRSQPWVFTDCLLMGFFAELSGSDRITVQESELAEAGWFPRDALPGEYSTISLTGEMIDLFRAGQEPRYFPDNEV